MARICGKMKPKPFIWRNNYFHVLRYSTTVMKATLRAGQEVIQRTDDRDSCLNVNVNSDHWDCATVHITLRAINIFKVSH